MSASEIHREICAVYDQNVMREGTLWTLYSVQKEVNKYSQWRAECSADHLSWVMILFEVLTKQFVKDGASQFRNFHVNFLV
jgi:hypothetical protein